MREAALVKLKTLLEGITVANGYGLDVKHVSRQWKAIDDVSDTQLPAVLIIDDGAETIDEVTSGAADVSFQVSIICYVKDRKNPSTALNLLDANMKKAIYSDLTLAGTVQAVRVLPYLQRDVSSLPPYAFLDRPIEITYEGYHATGL